MANPRTGQFSNKMATKNNLSLLILIILTTFTPPALPESQENAEFAAAVDNADDEESLFSQSVKHLFQETLMEPRNAFLDSKEATKNPEKNKNAKLKLTAPFMLANVELKCAEGWEHFEGKCFKPIPIERSWPQALAFCSRFGATLAKPESARENEFLAKIIVRPQRTAGAISTSEHWIGLLHRPASVDSESGGTFLWSDGTQTSRYVGFWARGQPDPMKGACTKAILDGNSAAGPIWQLDVCNLLLTFVCQRNACLKGSFFCLNGQCIPEQAHCNGFDECGDFSDEFNCPTAHNDLSCHRYEKGESGRIETPNFPANYKAGANCKWVLEGPINSKIQLNFDSFETEERQDLVTILDGGPSENSTISLATLSGTLRSPSKDLQYESSTNRMVIRFRADQNIQARGFQANWRAVSVNCGGHLKAQTMDQQLHSPEWPSGQYPNGMECVWRIEAPEGQLISLNINEFETELEHDFLVIYDGQSPSAPILAKFTGKKTQPELLISTKSMVYIYFFSSQTIVGKGFSIIYKKGCENTIRRSHGLITSPGNAHLPYANSQICRWNIELPSQTNIRPQIDGIEGGVEMLSLTLAINGWDVADLGDQLQIWEGGEQQGKALHPDDGFNGKNVPPKTIYSKQSNVQIVWRTNALNNGNGWNISFSTNCPRLILPSNRVLLSTKNTAYGSRVTVSCERGFEFVTGRGRHFDVECELGGKWSQMGPLPDCQPVYCSAIPQIANGFAVSATNVSFAGMARYECYDGFSFASGKKHQEIFCTEEARWTQPPKCKTDTCPALPVFQFGERILVFGDGIGFGSVYEFNCAKGYRREGPSSIVCQPNGQWSSAQSQCKKLSCFDLPEVENGEFQWMPSAEESGQNAKRQLHFGESLRVECKPGFRSIGAEMVKCLANQTLSGIPECKDIDECAEQSANCAPKSTECLNMAGGYHCKCQSGYRPQLVCSGSTSIQPSQVQTGHGIIVPPNKLMSKNGFCHRMATSSLSEGNSTENVQLTMIYTFPVPKIIEKLHFERILDPSGGLATQIDDSIGVWPKRFVLSYALEEGMPLEKYEWGLAEIGNTTMKNGTKMEGNVEMRTKGLGAIGSEMLILAKPIEARKVQIEFIDFHGGIPCVKMEFIGCQRRGCEDINECEDGRNGGCEQHCHNTQGGHKCSCDEGFDLFTQPGQSGVRLREGETGFGQFDSLRFNRSCIPRHCTPLISPQNGQLISLDGGNNEENRTFAFPSVVEFRCKFGHQMRGPSHLKCLADGTWNGSTPNCIPASCNGVKNSTAIGLFVQPDSVPIPFGQNLSFICSQTNRPPRHSALGKIRQCIFDPRTDGLEYWLSGPEVDCPLVDCGPPPTLSGAYYEGDEGHGGNFKVGSVYLFQCRAPYSLVGKSSYDDRMVRCNVDGTWDLGDLRCEGPVCVDPGHPDEGQTHLESVEEGAIARFTCNRPGFRPFPEGATTCSLGNPCVLSEDVGISSGFIPDGAFSDNSDKVIWGYEPHKSRMSSSGWCGSKDAFIFLSVDLQRIYTLTTLRLTGVAGNGHLAGHVTKMQLFYKVQFSQNYDNYPMEFTTPSGNHKKIHQFNLDPPLRARYILLGITEYEKNPCLKFDLQGCLAPLSAAHEVPSHLQVGWNSSIPQCIDAEPPVFKNCPQLPELVRTDENGQLLPANYQVPVATDNSGRIAYMRTKPEDFHPPYPVSQDTDIIYQAFDEAGNMAECVVHLRIPDTVPPIVKCPDSYAVWAQENQTELFLQFNESSVHLVVQDMSPIVQTTFEPVDANIKLGEHVTVEASVTDAHSNRNKCKFQVALLPEPCSPWSLQVDEETVQKDCQRHTSGTICQVECRKGFRFLESIPQQKLLGRVEMTQNGLPQKYSCSLEQQNSSDGGGKWTPSSMPPACVPMAMEPARYELHVHMNYSITAPLPTECLRSYELMVGSLFDRIDQVLSQRCSSTVQIYVRFLDAKFSQIDDKIMGANFTVQILPTVLQNVFYELCSLTLRTIFDLRIPGAILPIRSLLTLSGDSVPAAQNLGCPPMNATAIGLSQGFTCSQGELLKIPQDGVDSSFSPAPGLPECLPCPKGTAFVNNSCVQCPLGSFQDLEGQIRCKPCPENTHTLQPGAQSNESCLAVCGNGMFSSSGIIPCQLCPRHTFSGPPQIGGFKQCNPCPEGTYTARLGSVGPSQCKQPCSPGHFSVTGLEPCSPCPINFYQPNVGQQRCLQCSNDSFTSETGRSAEENCKKLDCQSIKCRNRGQCVVANHKEICECRPGYMGTYCEQQIPLCDSKPCLNGGTCELHNGGTFRCLCPQNFTGSRCQFGPDECISSVHCPNGGVCQDLPGLGTTKCICRTGFTGSDCSQIADPCQSEQPCQNGAQCVPLQLGRFKCKCLPGWEGINCERNIDDCADNPCALGAKCHDLINDFECECPHGFSGKRCQIKDDLCEPSPCLNGGQCVDTLFDRHCVCKNGWDGTFCEQEINECAQNPCKNGGTCRDQENGFACDCSPGYNGYECQYLVDHCAVGPCRNNGTCHNRGPTYECQCHLGFEGAHCEHNVDECETQMLCDGAGTERCEDLVNALKCHCRPGYEGTFCEQHVGQCEDRSCMNNSTCVDLGTGFQCECQPGWKGDRCQEMESQCEKKPCLNEGKCVPLVDDYFCVCPEGVSGKNCELAPNRCLGEPCHNGGVCGDFGSHSECACPKGFTGQGCQFRLDACLAGICKNGGICLNLNDEGNEGQNGGNGNGNGQLATTTPGLATGIGFKCICSPGFTGSECELNINECQPSPCPLAAECVDLVNGYYCKCPFNMTGANCEKRIEPDYDLHFLESANQQARAGLGIPFHFVSTAFTLSIWVRFEGQKMVGDSSKLPPTFFTLYNSRSPNEPTNLTELLRITSDAVHLKMFPSEQHLTLHFPSNQRPDTGHSWNNLIFTWNEGQYSLLWNAVRLYADKGYGGDGNKLEWNAWVNLGEPHSENEANNQQFVGSITRVNMWNRVLDFEQEIPQIVQRCQGSPVIFDGLVLRFANYDRLEGKVERMAKSSCGRNDLQCRSIDGIIECGNEQNEERNTIRIEGCPMEDIFVQTQMKEVNISWEEPKFVDETNGRIQIGRIEQNLKPGQMFTWGQYSAIYVAYNNRLMPMAKCQFKINVLREFCSEPEAPSNGMQQCEHWGPGLRYRACSIKCQNGFGFSRPPPIFYSCNEAGEWRPNEAQQRPFRYPQCTRQSPAEHLARIELVYPQLALCNSAGKSTLSDKLAQRIGQLNAKWHICEREENGECIGIQVQINCQDVSTFKRSKRQQQQQLFGVTIDVPIHSGPILDPSGSQQRIDPIQIIRDEALNRVLFSLEHVLPNGRPDLNSFRVQNAFHCSSGFVLVNSNCIPCSPGTFFSNNGECQLCPSGQYQPIEGQSNCQECPPERPITVGMGAIHQNDCKVRCQSGHHLNISSGQCEPCGFGFYQPESGAIDCLPCGIGKTTLERTSTDEEECRDECPDGEQLTQGGNCQPCPQGTFRTRGVDKQCVECPAGTTTEDIGSTGKEACNTPKCGPGQFLVVSEKRCQFCPRGTFQDQPLQTECRKCAPAFNTAKEGATRESQCYSTDQCALGQDNCSWNAQCIDLPDENDSPSWRCVCNPGYRGNGVNCTDACLNFCLNDGICRKNKLGHVECTCKENFSGERCEIRFQPRSQKLVYWTSVIVSIVFLLIVIVVVIWMISLRFNRIADNDFNSCPEKTAAIGLGPGADSPLTSNFLYGRPHPSLLDRSSHSSTTIRPIGFYYEDEQPYESGGIGRHGRDNSREVKMFLGGPDGSESTAQIGGDAAGGSSHSQSDSSANGPNGSPNSATRELEKRLKHIQQHMYRPSNE